MVIIAGVLIDIVFRKALNKALTFFWIKSPTFEFLLLILLHKSFLYPYATKAILVIEKSAFFRVIRDM